MQDNSNTGEQLIKSYYNFTEDQWNHILSKTFDKRYYEYASRKAWFLEQSDDQRDRRYDINPLRSWKKSYDAIRDVSWPNCDTVEEFKNLPEAIKHECINVHNFSADQWLNKDIAFDQWQEDTTWNIQTFDLIRLNYIIVENLEFITGKKVVDFAGHIGFFAGCCLHNGASTVTFTNIKEECVAIGDEMLSLIEPNTHRHQSMVADIHDYDYNRQICQEQDTVMLLGIMDIVYDHYKILESIANCAPKTIIIEHVEPIKILDHPEPLVYWWSEVTHTTWKGYHKDLKPIVVGSPNSSWFDLAMDRLGYTKLKQTRFKIWEAAAQDFSNEEDLSHHTVYVYVKQ
jgi:hypothetical protein